MGYCLCGPEILSNPSFETGSNNNWTRATSAVQSIYVTDDYPQDGAYHAWFRVESCTGAKLLFHQKGLTIPQSGANYLVTFQMAAPTGSNYVVGIYQSGNYGTDFGLDQTFTPSATSQDTWMHYGWNFDATANNSPAMLMIEPELDGEIYETLFDNFSFRQRIAIEPGNAYREMEILEPRFRIRTHDGVLHTYTGSGSRRRFEVPLTWISSKDVADINSWWDTGSDLRFYIDDDNPGSFFSVRIVGDVSPFQQYQRPYTDYMQGKLILETL